MKIPCSDCFIWLVYRGLIWQKLCVSWNGGFRAFSFPLFLSPVNYPVTPRNETTLWIVFLYFIYIYIYIQLSDPICPDADRLPAFVLWRKADLVSKQITYVWTRSHVKHLLFLSACLFQETEYHKEHENPLLGQSSINIQQPLWTGNASILWRGTQRNAFHCSKFSFSLCLSFSCTLSCLFTCVRLNNIPPWQYPECLL